jgi:CRP-like cAMP-binding protein
VAAGRGEIRLHDVEDFGQPFAPLPDASQRGFTSADRLTQSGGGACKNQINARSMNVNMNRVAPATAAVTIQSSSFTPAPPLPLHLPPPPPLRIVDDHEASNHAKPWAVLKRQRTKSRASIVALFTEDLKKIQRRRHHDSLCYRACVTFPILTEDSTFMLVWDLLLSLGLFWVLWAVPFEIGFAESLVPGERVRPGYEWLTTIDTVVDIFFWCDIFINFRVTFRERNTHRHVEDPYALAYNYATTWFLPDLLSVIPFSEFFAAAAMKDSSNRLGLIKMARILRFLKMTKLIRLLKIGNFIYVLEDRCGISPLFFSFVSLIAVVFMVIHLLASVFYLTSFTLKDIETSTFVASWIFNDQDVSDQDDVLSMYIAAMYWSCTTITTVGYGDIVPKSDGDRIFVFFAMILGAGMYGYIIAAMGNIITDMNAVSSIRRKKMMELSLFMDAKGLPTKLRHKVRESYRFWLERVSMYEEKSILNSLPQELREQIGIHYAHKIFSEPNGLFNNAHPQFVTKVLPMLRPVLFQPYSIILVQNDVAESMFIVTKGILDVEVKIGEEGEEGEEGEKGDGDEDEDEDEDERGLKGGGSNANLGQHRGRALSTSTGTTPIPPLSLSTPVVHTTNKKIATLLTGEIFGAMSLLRPSQNLRRCATVKSRDNFCELFEIHRDQVVDTWLVYPTVRQYLLELVERRALSHARSVNDAKIHHTNKSNTYWKKIEKARSAHGIKTV